MPKSINWDGVIQSINDFWLPILGIGGIIVIVVIIAVIYKKWKEKMNKK